MSSGYTRALATMAPAEPAAASPHAGSTSSFAIAGMFHNLAIKVRTSR